MAMLIWMETFAAVVEAGSFTKAADRLGISKSFVSKQITQLEKQLGIRLLHRSTRTLSLTDEGNQFYQHCNHIVSEAEKARNELLESQENPRGRIRLTIPQSLIISRTGDVLLAFQKRYPDIALEILVSGNVRDMIEEGIDLALRIGQLENSALICRKLIDCSFQIVAAPSYIEAHGSPQTPAELTGHNCLIYAGSKLGNHWPFRQADGKELSVNVKGNLVCDDGNMIIQGALEGLGIAFAPGIMFQPLINEGKLVPLLTEYAPPSTSISALYPSRQHLSRKVKLLVDFLSENLPLYIK